VDRKPKSPCHGSPDAEALALRGGASREESMSTLKESSKKQVSDCSDGSDR
jgi:hypothetical protein